MFIHQRIFTSDNGILTDVSIDLNDHIEGTANIELEPVNDFLYIASELPFNSRFFKGSTYNTTPTNIIVEYWTGRQTGWVTAVDVIDQTEGFTKDGYIRFNIPYVKRKSWVRENESSSVSGVGYEADVYSKYWARISIDTSLDVGTSLSFIGHLFSKDADLFSYYPDLRNTGLMAAWETGKTNWTEQAMVAAGVILRDLRRRNILQTRAGFGLMDIEMLQDASSHKTAHIIYGGLGDSFASQRDSALVEYKTAVDLVYYNTDKSGDGVLSGAERKVSTSFMRR